jgi:adenosine kinase
MSESGNVFMQSVHDYICFVCLKEAVSSVQVISQGKDPTIVARGGKVLAQVEVPRVEPEDIVDTNGAGDAFVGGFLAGHIMKKSMVECCKAGHYAASVIIKTSGVALPATCDYEW